MQHPLAVCELCKVARTCAGDLLEFRVKRVSVTRIVMILLRDVCIRC